MLVDTNEERGEVEIQTPEQILKQAVLDTRELDEERQKAEDVRDGKGIMIQLKERAEVIAGLPERISEAGRITGQEVSEDDMYILLSLQYIAQEALEGGRAHKLGMILTDTQGGSEIGKPNLLEQLVNRLYPQSPPK